MLNQRDEWGELHCDWQLQNPNNCIGKQKKGCWAENDKSNSKRISSQMELRAPIHQQREVREKTEQTARYREKRDYPSSLRAPWGNIGVGAAKL